MKKVKIQIGTFNSIPSVQVMGSSSGININVFHSGDLVKDWYKAIEYIYYNHTKNPLEVDYCDLADKIQNISVYIATLQKNMSTKWCLLAYYGMFTNNFENFLFLYDKETYVWEHLKKYCNG